MRRCVFHLLYLDVFVISAYTSTLFIPSDVFLSFTGLFRYNIILCYRVTFALCAKVLPIRKILLSNSISGNNLPSPFIWPHVFTTDPSLFSPLLEVSTRDGWLTVISRWAPRSARLLSEPRFPPRPRSVDGAAATVITCLLCRATTDPIPARASYFK